MKRHRLCIQMLKPEKSLSTNVRPPKKFSFRYFLSITSKNKNCVGTVVCSIVVIGCRADISVKVDRNVCVDKAAKYKLGNCCK